jgi:3-deoxy-D-manno-octulosonic-acid transferase
MYKLQEFLYNLVMTAYSLAIRIAAFRNSKAKRFVQGRVGLFQQLKTNIVTNEHYIWFHCASLGEFEQGRPLIEKLRHALPHVRLVLTFFSPSGYEMRKEYDHVDEVYYLPIDTPANAKQFVNLLNPKLAIFIKYDFWYNTLKALHEQQIPTLLVSGRFRTDQLFFKRYGRLARRLLEFFNHFFVQDTDSRDLLASLNIKASTVIPDTRIDRVHAMTQSAKALPEVANFKNGKIVMVGGSTYDEEEAWLQRWRESHTNPPKFIIAPHEPREERLKALEQRFKSLTIRYSEIRPNQQLENTPILLIDRVGMLGDLYQYGDLALIGGGFRKSIHNILEPAAHGLPLLFGPNHYKFPEANALIKRGGACGVQTYDEFQKQADNWLNDSQRKTAQTACRNFIKENLGGTETVYNYIIQDLDIPEFRHVPNPELLR